MDYRIFITGPNGEVQIPVGMLELMISETGRKPQTTLGSNEIKFSLPPNLDKLSVAKIIVMDFSDSDVHGGEALSS